MTTEIPHALVISASEKEDATTDRRSSYSVEQEIIGNTIIKLSQSFIYQVQGGSVVATKSCVTSSFNFNIAVALSEDASHWTQGSHGICETTWHGNIFFRDPVFVSTRSSTWKLMPEAFTASGLSTNDS